jgi:hypothetical protein
MMGLMISLTSYLVISHKFNTLEVLGISCFRQVIITKARKDDDAILQGIIGEHSRIFDTRNPVDFVDDVLSDKIVDGELASVSTIHLLLDTFLGGTDTSSATNGVLCWNHGKLPRSPS